MTSSTTNRWVIGVVGTVAATLLLAASASQQPAQGRSDTARARPR
jgi:hypothetical protein